MANSHRNGERGSESQLFPLEDDDEGADVLSTRAAEWSSRGAAPRPTPESLQALYATPALRQLAMRTWTDKFGGDPDSPVPSEAATEDEEPARRGAAALFGAVLDDESDGEPPRDTAGSSLGSLGSLARAVGDESSWSRRLDDAVATRARQNSAGSSEPTVEDGGAVFNETAQRWEGGASVDLSGFDDQSVATAETPRNSDGFLKPPPPLRASSPAKSARRRASSLEERARPPAVVCPALLKEYRDAEKRHDREIKRFLRGGGDGDEADDVPRALASLGLDNNSRAVTRLARPTASAARRASVVVAHVIPGHVRDVNDWLRGGAPARTLELGERAGGLRRDVERRR